LCRESLYAFSSIPSRSISLFIQTRRLKRCVDGKLWCLLPFLLLMSRNLRSHTVLLLTCFCLLVSFIRNYSMCGTKLMLFAATMLAFAQERGTAIELHYPIRPHGEPDEATRVVSPKAKRVAMDGLRMRRKLKNVSLSTSVSTGQRPSFIRAITPFCLTHVVGILQSKSFRSIAMSMK
jgi:hypothetical protein